MYKQQESWSNKNDPHEFTECVQYQVLNQIQQQICKGLLSPFPFT